MAETTCANKAQTLDEIFKDVLTIDDAGVPAIRVVNGVDSGVPFIDCDNRDLTWEEILKSLIVQDCNGLPALNLAAFPCP
jgi:hypothetical protein